MCAALSQTQVVQSGWIVDSCCGGAGNDFVEKCRDREKKPYMYTFQGTQSVDATKKLDLWKMPPVLIVILKRFEVVDMYGNSVKRDDQVAFPVQDLDFRGHVTSVEREQPLYDLFAYSNHMACFGGGHYTAVANNRVDDQWYLFNDSDVSPVAVGSKRERRAAAKSAYVLFYNRVLAGGEDMDASMDAVYGGGSDLSLGSDHRHHAPVVRRQSVTLPHLWPHYSADSLDDDDDAQRLPVLDEE